MADATEPIGVLQVCGAITTWLGNNPAYCVYELDKETMLPISRRTYYFDLEAANESGTPEWKLGTDWTVDFGMKDLSPSSFKAVTERLGEDEAFTVSYKDHKYRIPGHYNECDKSCRTEEMCESRYIDPYSAAQCNGKPIYDWTGDFMGSFR